MFCIVANCRAVSSALCLATLSLLLSLSLSQTPWPACPSQTGHRQQQERSRCIGGTVQKSIKFFMCSAGRQYSQHNTSSFCFSWTNTCPLCLTVIRVHNNQPSSVLPWLAPIPLQLLPQKQPHSVKKNWTIYEIHSGTVLPFPLITVIKKNWQNLIKW